MEKKKNGKSILIGILVVIIIVLASLCVFLLFVRQSLINDLPNGNKQENISSGENASINKDNVTKWLTENSFISKYINNFDISKNEDVVNFLTTYMWNHGNYEMLETHAKYTLSKKEAKDVINKYLGIENFETDLNTLEDNMWFTYESDNNNYYVSIRITDGYADFCNLQDIYQTSNGEIVALYVRFNEYASSDDMKIFNGTKKIVLKENNGKYQLLRVEIAN